MDLVLRQRLWSDQECRQSSKLQIAEELRAHRVFSFLPISRGMLKILVDHGTHPQYVKMVQTGSGLVLRNGNEPDCSAPPGRWWFYFTWWQWSILRYFISLLCSRVVGSHILHQKAEVRGHRDLDSSMVVGIETALFFGGEPLAINVNRFNPWCYSLRIAVMYSTICATSTDICQYVD